LAKRNATPATDLGRTRADTQGGERAGVAWFGSVDRGGVVGGVEFGVVA
jgi:hypothetical protein